MPVLYSPLLCCAHSGALCCAVLCCAALRCAVLCCAVLCCAVLCCAVLQSSCTADLTVHLESTLLCAIIAQARMSL